MYPQPLDDFAARSVGLTLAEFARNERCPASGRAVRPARNRRRARLPVIAGGTALAVLPAVAVVAQLLR